MKLLLPAALGVSMAIATGVAAFAQCSHGYVAADVQELNIASEKKKTVEAISTHDPQKKNVIEQKAAEKKAVITE